MGREDEEYEEAGYTDPEEESVGLVPTVPPDDELSEDELALIQLADELASEANSLTEASGSEPDAGTPRCMTTNGSVSWIGCSCDSLDCS